MYYKFNHLDVDYFEISSECLRDNPLGDPAERIHPVLKAKAAKDGAPTVFVLAGFTGNGPFYLNKKFGAKNFAEVLDQAVGAGEAPVANYVLVDGMTFWGGGQFINSPGCGRYQDHLVDEVLPDILQKYSGDPAKVAVVGGSSGGYGALHLGSLFPEKFPWVAAVAPDSAFELSLLPEITATQGKVESLGGISEVRKMIQNEKLFKRRDWHDLLNVIGMAYCYGRIQDGEPVWPLDWRTAETNEEWSHWLGQDPVHFLRDRADNLRRLKGVFIEVGNRDQFMLHYGSRRIHDLLKEFNIDHHYQEFDGTHFDISSRRIEIWRWLF